MCKIRKIMLVDNSKRSNNPNDSIYTNGKTSSEKGTKTQKNYLKY